MPSNKYNLRRNSGCAFIKTSVDKIFFSKKGNQYNKYLVSHQVSLARA